jgi:hypothetical protein
LYVVDGAPEEYVGITIMHELVHALQDQYVNLDSLEQPTTTTTARSPRRRSSKGRRRTSRRTSWPAGREHRRATARRWESMRQTIREMQATQPVFRLAPTVIQETLLFPYINGATSFVASRRATGKLPLTDMPISTKQLMHDSAFFAKTRDVPSEVTLPSIPARWIRTDSASSGRGSTSISTRRIRTVDSRLEWLGRRPLRAGEDAERRRLVWATVWETPGDAAEFMSAIDQVMRERFNFRPRVNGERRHFETDKRVSKSTCAKYRPRPSCCTSSRRPA